MEKLKEFLEKNKNAKILDVGTGRGNFIALLDYLNKDYKRIIGIDIFEPAVKAASKFFEKNEKVEIMNADINDNQFKDGEFDIVCLSNSLHHLVDIEKTILAMERLVKPNGYIIFNEMMSDHLNEKQISHKLIHHFSAKIDSEIGMYHAETFTRSEIIEVIQKNSTFKMEEYWDMNTPKEDMSQEQIESFAQTVDRILDRAKEESKEKYKQEAKEVKDYIIKNGLESCTQLLVITKNTQ